MEDLEFIIEGKGKITIPDIGSWLENWFLLKEDDSHEHVNAEWFYNKLKDNEEGIYQFCSQVVGWQTDSDEIKASIKKYEDKCDAEIEGCGFDTVVCVTQDYMQEATKTQNLYLL